MWGPSLNTRWHLATLSKRKSDFRQPPSGRRIVVYEMPFNDDHTDPFPVEGRQYSLSDLSEMLTESRFRDIETKATFGYWNIVTATKS